MDTAQEQRKRKVGTDESSSQNLGKDVFDTVGNDGLRAHLEQARQTVTDEDESVLSLVEAEVDAPDTALEDEEETQIVAAPEVIEEQPVIAASAVAPAAPVTTEVVEQAPIVEPVPVVEQVPVVEPVPVVEAAVVEHAPIVEPAVVEQAPVVEPALVEQASVVEPEIPVVAQAPAVETVEETPVVAVVVPVEAPVVEEEVPAASIEEQAEVAGIDPVLLMDPSDLGSSDLAKERALGAEGELALQTAVAAAGATLGVGTIDDAAMKLVGEQIREDLAVEEIVEARKTGGLDTLVQDSLRRGALRSRDEVIFLLQELVHEDRELLTMLSTGDPGTLAVEIIEYLAVMLVELGDLYALAAYDHGDILKKIVIGDDAVNAQKTLSPLALRMGGFATVLYQMVVDELTLHPLPQDPNMAGEQDPTTLVDPFGQNLLQLVAMFRQFRTATA